LRIIDSVNSIFAGLTDAGMIKDFDCAIVARCAWGKRICRCNIRPKHKYARRYESTNCVMSHDFPLSLLFIPVSKALAASV
jgi:hypothetical protein